MLSNLDQEVCWNFKDRNEKRKIDFDLGLIMVDITFEDNRMSTVVNYHPK